MSSKCSKCEGDLAEGWLADLTHGGIKPLCWVAGKPEASFWQGTRMAKEDSHQVVAFCCQQCGFLEFYAKQKSRAQEEAEGQ